MVRAEVDFKICRPGYMTGLQQSGVLNFGIADIVKDSEILKIARSYAAQTLKAALTFLPKKIFL